MKEEPDKIFIRDLGVRCIIGINPRERKIRQRVVLNVTLEGDFSVAAKSDRIEDAVNYKTITKSIIALVEQSRFNLIESLAERVAGLCLQNRKIRRVTVVLDKPGALRFARSVAVEITRPGGKRNS